MTININGFPYWDDFNEAKGFHQILFKPGFGVQARELNQIQSILQKQIDRFGKHIFKEGSLVLGGQFDIDTNVAWVDIEGFSSPAAGERITDLEKQVIQAANGVEAYVLKVVQTSETAATLFIRYLASGEDESEVFTTSQALTVKDGVMTASTVTVDAVGFGSLFSIEEGVLFSSGYFVKFDRQSVSLGKTKTPSFVVGFEIDIDIKTNNQDISLLDNAQGSYNFLAPGADRLHFEATLVARDLPESDAPEIESSEDFAMLFIIQNGELLQIKERPQYSEIYNELAERTYEESGDYVVNGFGTVVREHLDTGIDGSPETENEGLLKAADGGDNSLLAVGILDGVAYVKGHRIENHVTHYVNTPKSATYSFVNNEILSAAAGNYVVVNDTRGAPKLDSGTVVTLYDAKQVAITDAKNVTASAVGTAIGTAKVREFQYNSGTPDTIDATYRLYLFDIKMNPGTAFTQVQGFKIANKFMADVETLPATLVGASQERLVYPIGASSIRSVRSEGVGEPVDTSITFRSTYESVAIPENGEFSVSVGGTGEVHGFGSGVTLSNTQKRSIILTLESGAHVNLDSATVTATTNKQLDFAIGATSTQTGTITLNAVRPEAQEASKALHSSRFVKFSGVTNGPVSLGFADVLRIKRVLRHTADITTTEMGTDITDQCRLDNGQRDSFYDHARLFLPSGGTGSHLLVELDHFVPSYASGVGYFSVDSYPINDEENLPDHIFTHEIPVYKSPVTGNLYDLRDHLDFRPVKVNTATSATTVDGASLNPATTESFITPAGGMRIPASGSQISTDYSYYLARRDVLAVDKEGNYEIIKGVPAVNPTTPETSENVMRIAMLYIPPYPSLATTYANNLGKPERGVRAEQVTHQRHTMREIGVLKKRIETLEYYNALSLLERSAVEMSVLDQNGLDRFKNGFFVDGFMDHSLGASNRPDYSISIDRQEQILRPFFDMNSYKFIPYTESNTQTTNGLITTVAREANDAVLLEQMNATTTRNIEQSVFRFIGNVYLSPDDDVWVDTKRVDANRVSFGENLKNTMFQQWNSWEDHIVGYNAYGRKRGDRSGNVNNHKGFLGEFDTAAEAYAAADTRKRSIVETVTQEQRTGVQTNVNYQKDTQSLGERVIDVSVQPYIRPQEIRVQVRGVKARTRYHIFFDGENMNAHFRPANIIGGSVSYSSFGSWGGAWKSDEYGELYGILRLPSRGKRFRIGSREVKVTDSPTNSVDASSHAVGHFFAHGMTQTKQNTILSTKTPVITQVPLVQKKKVKQQTEVLGPSCMAYSFKPEVPEGEVGCFLTKADVWVDVKHPTLGVWFEIREMDNAGNITRNQVPHSEVWYTSAQVNVTNGATPTEENKFTVHFPAPIFLYNDTEYAFVIHTEGLNPDYYFWISRLGETNVMTGKQVNARQLTGNVYTTNNNMNWDMVPDIDLMVRFYRADFQTGVSGVIEFANAPYEFMTVSTTSTDYFDSFGETINSSQILTLGSILDGPILVGDTIVQGANTGEVVAISGSDYYTTGLAFTTGDITVDGKTATATITNIKQGTATLYRSDEDKKTIELDGSNGLFRAGMTITGANSGLTGTIVSVDDWKFSTTQIKPNHLVLNNTDVQFEHRARLSGSSALSPWEAIDVDSNISFDVEKRILSKSNEVVSAFSPPHSSYVRATLSTTSRFVSPVIDMTRINGVYVHNLINNDTTGETEPSGGALINRYISKIVTLADGQDAEDLLVTLTAYRPPNSDVKVWVKIKHAEDGELIDDKEWIALEPQNEQFSSLVNKNDFKEMEFKFPEAIMIGTDGAVRYTANDNNFSGFKQFMIKIGLLGTNSAIPPKVGDLRAIALQL